MAERVRFYFDPLCPWTYQTSRWVRRLQELGEIELDWGVFSLEIANEGSQMSRDKGHAKAQLALRTTIAVRETAGSAGVEGFYAALGAAYHERGEALEDPQVVVAALEAAGLDPSLAEKAADDPTTWERVQSEQRDLIEHSRSFGVPTVVLDGGEGPAIFGPIISHVPTDEDSVELWRHVEWLARYENFSELKRERAELPDLVSVKGMSATLGEDALRDQRRW